jgi:DNA repair protein RadC
MQIKNTKYKIKNLPEDQRPREKLISKGASFLNDAELVAIIIRSGTYDKTALELSYDILAGVGSIEGLQNVGVAELCKIKGVGYAKACQIKAAVELARRISNSGRMPGFKVCCSRDVYNVVKDKFLFEKKEYFYILLLDVKNRIIKECMISQGTLTSSLVHPREVFNPAIKESAASIVLIHNHPSGDPYPSKEDIELTGQLKQVSEVVGIKILDHLIIGRDSYYSFAEHSL